MYILWILFSLKGKINSCCNYFMVLENPWQQSPSLRYEELWYKEGRLIVCELYQTGWVVVDGRIWDNAVNLPLILKQINFFWNFLYWLIFKYHMTASFAQYKKS